MCGSPCYVSPEMLLRQPYDGVKVDLWASGVILYAMLCGTLPFQDPNMNKLKQQIMTTTYDMPDTIDQDARHLIESILQKDPSKRPSINEIREHQWLQKLDCVRLSHEPIEKEQNAISQETLDILQTKFNIDSTKCEINLQNKQLNNSTTAYKLVYKKIRAQKHFKKTEDDESNIIQRT